MAVVSWPSDVLVTAHDIQAVNPSQIVHELPNINSIQVFEQGYGTWLGSSTLGVRYDGKVVEGLLASMNGVSNVVEMPLLRDTISGSNVAITAATGNAYTLASRPTGIATGVYVRSGNRLFIVQSVTTGNTPLVTLWPYYPLGTSDTLGPATTIRVRSRGAVTMPRVRGWYGPWTFRWAEAVHRT